MFNSRYFPIFLALLLALSVLPVLGLPGISSSSEARETHVAAIIKASNEWILPDRNGFVPSKPLLHHWITVVTSHFTGTVDEFSSRFPSALLGIVVIVSLFLFSKKLFEIKEFSSRKSAELAFLTALILTTTYGFFSMMLLSMVDMTFSSFVVLGLFWILFKIFEQVLKEKEGLSISQSDWSVFFVCCALATLAKGPLGLILPCIILGAVLFTLLGLKKTCILTLKPNFGWLIYVSLSLPWYYLAKQRSGSSFVDRQIFFENIKRFTGAENINAEPFWFYIPGFIERSAPWSVFFIILIIWQLRSKRQQLLTKDIIRPLLIGITAALVFFSVSSGKRNSYLLPLYPLCAFAGVWIYAQWSELVNVTKKDRVNNLLKIIAKWICVLIVLISLGTILFMQLAPASLFHKNEILIAQQFIHANALRLIFGPLLALIALAFCFLRKKENSYCSVASLFIVCAFLSSILSASAGIKAAYKDYPQMAKEIEFQSAGRTIVAVRDRYDELLDPVFLYLGFPIQILDPKAFSSLCSPNALYMARQSTLADFGQEVKVVEELLLTERAGKARSVKERAISLFHCSYS